jgi:hypothetical protein
MFAWPRHHSPLSSVWSGPPMRSWLSRARRSALFCPVWGSMGSGQAPTGSWSHTRALGVRLCPKSASVCARRSVRLGAKSDRARPRCRVELRRIRPATRARVGVLSFVELGRVVSGTSACSSKAFLSGQRAYLVVDRRNRGHGRFRASGRHSMRLLAITPPPELRSSTGPQ